MPINKQTSLEQIIRDFIDSDDKRFSGKSKEERINMAKGAYNSMHNESTELDEDYSPKNPKIDIYHKGEYKASTNFSPTLKHAKEGWLQKHPEHDQKDIKCYKSIKEDNTMKENINTLISAVSNDDKEAANTAFATVLMDKVADKLHEMKVEVAGKFFGDIEEKAKFDDGVPVGKDKSKPVGKKPVHTDKRKVLESEEEIEEKKFDDGAPVGKDKSKPVGKKPVHTDKRKVFEDEKE